MLNEISLKNVGVFQEATLRLEPGMTAITGETGAGKSMLLSSLGLIAGETPERIKSLKDTLVGDIEVEASFSVSNESVHQLVRDAGGYADDELLISRTIDAKTKRASAVLGGKKVPSALLKEVAEHLVIIHGQQDHLQLRSAQKVRELLDRYACAALELDRYQTLYANFTAAQREYTSSEERSTELKKNYEYYKYIVAQVEALDPQPGEEESLLKQKERIAHAGEVGQLLSAVVVNVDGDDEQTGISASLGQLERNLVDLTNYLDDDFAAELYAFGEFYPILSDISAKMQRRLADLEYSLTDLEYVDKRLGELSTLTNSWGPMLEDVFNAYRNAQENIAAFEQLSDLDELKAKRDAAENDARKQAEVLHSLRATAAKEFSAAVTAQLVDLGFNDAAISLDVQLGSTLGTYGVDTFKLLFSPHSSVPPGAIDKVASGGELSRIMLAVEIVNLRRYHSGQNAKTARKAASGDAGFLMVFDEVDAGVGGEVANKVATLLSEIAKDVQIVVVTHLAQIAAKADQQFSIAKQEVEAGDTKGMYARIEKLEGEKRLAEIARMLSGEPSETALAHAQEMLGK